VISRIKPEIGHGGCICNPEIGKHCNSGYSLPQETSGYWQINEYTINSPKFYSLEIHEVMPGLLWTRKI
jgi:hypothetical protein